ncbi:unnamed protein product [Sympodiomycopsis kandeliae]
MLSLLLLPFVWLLAGPLTSVYGHEYSSNATACTRHYTVQDSDTCDIIGQKTLTSTYQILAYNLPKAGRSCYTLQTGADLCLGRYGSDCQLVHRARGNDNCYTITQQYGISEETLLDNNPSLDCGQVYDGLVLCVAPNVMRPPPVAALQASIRNQRNAGGSRRRALELEKSEEDLEETSTEAYLDENVDEAAPRKLPVGRRGHGVNAHLFAHQS